MSEFVEEFKIGNTNVKIADDYCRDKTPEDVNAILKRIGVNALPHFAMNKQDKAGVVIMSGYLRNKKESVTLYAYTLPQPISL